MITTQSDRVSVIVIQEANEITYSKPTLTLSYPGAIYSGGTIKPTAKYSQTRTYTSGSSNTLSSGGSFNYTINNNSWATITANNGNVVVSKYTGSDNTNRTVTINCSLTLNGYVVNATADLVQSSQYAKVTFVLLNRAWTNSWFQILDDKGNVYIDRTDYTSSDRNVQYSATLDTSKASNLIIQFGPMNLSGVSGYSFYIYLNSKMYYSISYGYVGSQGSSCTIPYSDLSQYWANLKIEFGYEAWD